MSLMVYEIFSVKLSIKSYGTWQEYGRVPLTKNMIFFKLRFFTSFEIIFQLNSIFLYKFQKLFYFKKLS